MAEVSTLTSCEPISGPMNGASFPEETGLPAEEAPGLDAADFASRDPRDAMSLQTAWLRSFLAVADKSGFAAATLVLHLSQSRVSAHIAALHWARRRADSAAIKAFLDAQQQVPLPPGVQPIPDRDSWSGA